jgi:tetratricopeptide (TPR) repeat protein
MFYSKAFLNLFQNTINRIPRQIRNGNHITVLTAIVLILFSSISFAQSNRSLINKGVDKYDEKKYSDAEVDFRKVVEGSPKNFDANYNLGDSYYKQQKYEEAIKSYTSALENTESDANRAKVYYNIGNSLLKDNKIEQSIEAYKNALKYNPDDDDTKYNLSYALELLKNKNQKKDQQNKNDQNKNDQNKKDQQKQENQNQDQQNKDQKKQDQKQNPQPKDQESKQDNTKQKQQPKENQISKEEAQRILDALKNNEKDLQKKLRKKTGTVRPTDKDW